MVEYHKQNIDQKKSDVQQYMLYNSIYIYIKKKNFQTDNTKL